MAKDLIRTRHQIEKFYKLKSQLQGVSLRIQVYLLSIINALIFMEDIHICNLSLKKALVLLRLFFLNCHCDVWKLYHHVLLRL